MCVTFQEGTKEGQKCRKKMSLVQNPSLGIRNFQGENDLYCQCCRVTIGTGLGSMEFGLVGRQSKVTKCC